MLGQWDQGVKESESHNVEAEKCLERGRLWTQTYSDSSPCCVTLGESLGLSEPQFSEKVIQSR